MRIFLLITLMILLFGCVKPKQNDSVCWECTYLINDKDMGAYACGKLPDIPVNAINIHCKQVSKPIQ
jgi:hypothetical protein